MRQHPNNENDPRHWNQARAAEFERRSIAADVAPVQLERGEAAKDVKQQHRHVGKNGESLEARAERKGERDCCISDDRHIRRAESRMHMRKPFREEAVATKSKEDSRGA
jgi:hypothetical protein